VVLYFYPRQHEEHQSSGRVDYGFYLDSRLKFYLEAKSLGSNLHKEEFANQAIKYSWNKGATWAILTDFESIKVFNAQDINRSLGDKLFFEIPYTQYLERFDQLWLLSKDSFKENLLDKEAEKVGKKFQKIAVTTLLYKDLDNCRQILTDHLSQWNKGLDKDLLDEGVQKLLDRLIFLRVAEDRNIEPPTLIPLIRDWENNGRKGRLYESMIQKFRELDLIYNSGLFSEHPFEGWDEYSNATEKVINILYGKEGYYEYDFKAMPADVLGTVYENYLGYRLDKSKKGISIGKDAKKRKEHGIYYTPTFIVDYIVKNTLKPVLDKCHSVGDLKKIKVLDPACGSGSFLIKALDTIYDKYLEFGNSGGVFTKLDIILNNIYGVDLDSQAVEITRLNLLINALDQRMRLPGLEKNIRNGNSLISGTDEELTKYFGKNFRDKKPFNWDEEFPEVFEQGGFDVVIGNPPYVRVDSLDNNDKNFWKDTFQSSTGKYDLYYLFVENSIKLLKTEGKFGYIIPNKFCVADSANNLRKIIIDSSTNCEFLSVSKIDIFKDASNYPVILTLEKGNNIRKIKLSFALNEEEIILNKFNRYSMSEEDFNILPNQIVPINVGVEDLKLVVKLIKERKQDKLGQYLKISEGLRIPEKYESITKEKIEIVKQYQFERYSIIKKGSFINEDNLKRTINPKSLRFVNILKDKILIAEDALFINATFDKEKYIPQGGVYFGTSIDDKTNIKYLLVLLNSKLLSFIYKTLFGGMHMGGGYLRYRTNFLEQLPIIPVKNDQESSIIDLVNKIMKLNKGLQEISENSEKWKSIKSEIEKTDKKIDEEVYTLYGLTNEEIKIVEED